MREPAEVFRSQRHRPCEERAFMLMAVGIDSDIVPVEQGYSLVVEQPLRAHALHHLHQYEQERVPQPETTARFTPQPDAWIGSVVYALLLLIPPFALAQGWFRGDPYETGALNPALVMAGEWWRVVTALTLHWDASHLLGNLGGGALLGYSVAQVWGSARAWLLILVSAAVANVLESLLGLSNYVSAGASTAVFAALGLIVAFAWHARRQKFGSPLARLAPLIAGVAMLGFFGAGSSVPVAGLPAPDVFGFQEPGSTNVLSHLLGFVCGAAMGALAAAPRGASLLARVPGWAATGASLIAIAVSWALAQQL